MIIEALIRHSGTLQRNPATQKFRQFIIMPGAGQARGTYTIAGKAAYAFGVQDPALSPAAVFFWLICSTVNR